jgi:geranylgeranylglycerol-phosphate geranylgeranyltransferase
VWVGAVSSGAPHATIEVAVAALGAAAIAAAGNGMNDVIDVEIDCCNRPGRPLPSGRLSVGPALIISSLLGIAGLGLAFFAGVGPGMIAFAVVVGLALYNWLLKRVGLVGNLFVSMIAAATFAYGAAAAGNWGRWWIPALFAALYHMARELIKGFEDTEGDRLMNVRTVSRVHGGEAACRTAAVLLGLVALAAPLPTLLGIYGWGYLAAILVLGIFLAGVIYQLWAGLSPEATRLSPRLLIGMGLGLVAILLGELLDRA